MSIAAFGRRLSQKDDRHSWRTHIGMVRDAGAWENITMRTYPLLDRTDGRVTAYVGNFRRPQNIQPIVRALLASSSVARVIVSNNNPDCRLGRWLRLSSPRLQILSHREPQNCFMRYVHLQPFAGERNLMMDDDVFLQPPQIDALNAFLESDSSVPHGIYGQRWNGECFIGGVQREEGRIDVISRVYAFTGEHLQRVLMRARSVDVPAGYEDRGYGLFDDILLSLSGADRPFIHDVGAFTDCPTQGRKGTANWREDGFHRGREMMYRRLQAAPLPAAA